MYSEFFNLCGFEPEEIEGEASRIDKAFKILEIGPDDVDEATERVKRFFDLELLGIRKALGLWVKELVDMVLAKEEGKKIVYASFPPLYQVMTAMSAASDEIYCIVPEAVLSTTMNCIFGRMYPILETAEKNGLAPGIAYCSYLKTRFGAIVKGIIPKPDLAVPSCLFCDQSPKTDEFLHELYGFPVTYIDNIMEDSGEQWPQTISRRRVEYIASDIKETMEKFGQRSGHEVTEEKARQAIEKKAVLFNTANKLGRLLAADPIPLSLADFEMARRIAFICSRRALNEGVDVLNLLHSEVEQRIKKGVGLLKKGAPRIMWTALPYFPPIQTLPEQLGLAVPVTAFSLKSPGEPTESYPTVWEEIADSLLRRRGAHHSSLSEIKQVKEIAQDNNVDGVIVSHIVGCRQTNSWPLKAKEMIEKEMNIPVLVLEVDLCDDRDYSAQQMRTRMETFAQIVKTAKAERDRIE